MAMIPISGMTSGYSKTYSLCWSTVTSPPVISAC